MDRLWLLVFLGGFVIQAATFEVNVTQSSYQAEENYNITLEWTFTTTAQGFWRQLFVDCSLFAPPKELFLYQVHEGVEIPESEHGQFSGRVQSDKDVLTEGRIRLHVSRLRIEDSGLYLCDVKTEDGFGTGSCQVNVTAADQLQTQRPTLTPESERGAIIISITAALIIFFIIIVVILIVCCSRNASII